jgi:hypothetical protein
MFIKTAIASYSESAKFSPHPHIFFFKADLNTCTFPSRFSTTLCFLIHATCTTHLTLLEFVMNYKYVVRNDKQKAKTKQTGISKRLHTEESLNMIAVLRNEEETV